MVQLSILARGLSLAQTQRFIGVFLFITQSFQNKGKLLNLQNVG